MDHPSFQTYMVGLPSCRLHVMEAGDGPPLIMVPATISSLENWVDLVQFMAQWFRVYFFELPGHGESTPYPSRFTTDQVAKTVEELADHFHMERFNLMGFSFGGILAMKTFFYLHQRIDRLILIAPCLTKRAVLLPNRRIAIVRNINRFLSLSSVQSGLFRLLQYHSSRSLIVKFFQRLGRIERTIQLEKKLGEIHATTLNVLTTEIEEILTIEFPHLKKYTTPCYFAMSIYDPLLDYQTSLNEAQSHFENLNSIELYFPFHQPPQPFTVDELNDSFQATVHKFLGQSLNSSAK